MKIIIIGGVAGGATTAARIRRVDETAEIILLEKGKYISYANCGLPYYIGGVIEERDKLFVQTPEAFSTRFRIDVRTENEAIFIDRKRKTVTIRQSSEDTYEESYDKLVISTGASPVRPPLPGIDLSGIFTLRNVTDTDRIKEYIKSHAPRKAVIVGAGFIGLEMAENLHTQGAKVSIVEMGNQVISKDSSGGKSVVVIEKGEPKSCNIVTSCEGKGKTFIMFSDDLDKALATFVLANGAAATGQKVTIFFTFWGLNVIKKLHKPETKKDIFGKMFGMMLPSSSKKLKLSKMSMGGIGGKMMRYIMNKKGIDSLESLRQQALENGVEFIACQMSMDVMGVKQEELLDEVTIGGVATYMERADNANVNLFI